MCVCVFQSCSDTLDDTKQHLAGKADSNGSTNRKHSCSQKDVMAPILEDVCTALFNWTGTCASGSLPSHLMDSCRQSL